MRGPRVQDLVWKERSESRILGFLLSQYSNSCRFHGEREREKEREREGEREREREREKEREREREREMKIKHNERLSNFPHQGKQLPSSSDVTVSKGCVDDPLNGLVCVLPRYHGSLTLTNGVEDGVGRVKNVGQHGSQLGTGNPFIFVEIEDFKEKHAPLVK